MKSTKEKNKCDIDIDLPIFEAIPKVILFNDYSNMQA